MSIRVGESEPSAIPDEFRACNTCGYETIENISRCPGCGSALWSVKQKRRRGWALLACGVMLTVMIGTITLIVGPSLLSPDVPFAGGTRFAGTRQQGILELGLFSVLILFGLIAIAVGVHWITGTNHSKRLFHVGVGLYAALRVVMQSLRSVGL